MKLVMLGNDEGGEFHRTATIEDVKEFLYMQEMVAVPVDPTDKMTGAGIRENQESCGYNMSGSTLDAIYKAMIKAAGEGV